MTRVKINGVWNEKTIFSFWGVNGACMMSSKLVFTPYQCIRAGQVIRQDFSDANCFCDINAKQELYFIEKKKNFFF